MNLYLLFSQQHQNHCLFLIFFPVRFHNFLLIFLFGFLRIFLLDFLLIFLLDFLLIFLTDFFPYSFLVAFSQTFFWRLPHPPFKFSVRQDNVVLRDSVFSFVLFRTTFMASNNCSTKNRGHLHTFFACFFAYSIDFPETNHYNKFIL